MQISVNIILLYNDQSPDTPLRQFQSLFSFLKTFLYSILYMLGSPGLGAVKVTSTAGLPALFPFSNRRILLSPTLPYNALPCRKIQNKGQIKSSDTGPGSSVVRVSASGNGRSRIRSRAATKTLQWY